MRVTIRDLDFNIIGPSNIFDYPSIMRIYVSKMKLVTTDSRFKYKIFSHDMDYTYHKLTISKFSVAMMCERPTF